MLRMSEPRCSLKCISKTLVVVKASPRERKRELKSITLASVCVLFLVSAMVVEARTDHPRGRGVAMWTFRIHGLQLQRILAG